MKQPRSSGASHWRALAGALGVALLGASCSLEIWRDAHGPLPCSSATIDTQTPTCTYRVLQTYPHDSDAFTQGLIYVSGVLYEATGLYGESSLREVDLETGKLVRTKALPDGYFGEGITLHEGRIIQLTWRNQIGFVYDERSFARLAQFSYPTEGWGITHDGERLIMSDGTATLRFLDPQSFEELSSLEVTDQGVSVDRLNELEFIRGEVYANVWQTDLIARISPDTGSVLAWIDLTGLLGDEERASNANVLNGIAFDSRQGHLLVTGKRWPKLFRIELLSP